MIKLLPLGIALVLMLGVLTYLRLSTKSSSPQAPVYPSLNVAVKQGPKSPVEDRVQVLEDTVVALGKQVTILKPQEGSVTGTTPQTSNTTDIKIKNLEDAVLALQKQVEDLQKLNSNSSTQTSTKSPLYIPLGSGGSTTGKGWDIFDNYQITLDPKDYGGYSGMQLELVGKMIQSDVDTGYARLLNTSDNTAVSSSDISITSDKNTLAVSSGFKLASGKKSYKLQVKTTNGYEFYLQYARIKVTF